MASPRHFQQKFREITPELKEKVNFILGFFFVLSRFSQLKKITFLNLQEKKSTYDVSYQ